MAEVVNMNDYREPRAPLELEEAELRALIELAAEADGTILSRPEVDSLYFKARRALEVETGPGGLFCDPA